MKGYKNNISNILARDDGYDIWGGWNGNKSGDLDSVVRVIDILKSPKVIEISSNDTYEDSWSSGSETSNSCDPNYQLRG